MEIVNLLVFSNRKQLRQWFESNHNIEKQCWVLCSRSKNVPEGVLSYIEVVEEALCFGSHWTELNKQRCADLEKRGLMTDAGRNALPK